MDFRTDRRVVAVTAIVLALVAMVLMHLLLPRWLAIVFLDIDTATYPFTVQNVMWVVFFVGLGEVFVRRRVANEESRHLTVGYLPEDERTVLLPEQLGSVYSRARQNTGDGEEEHFLPALITRCILQFQTSRSPDQARSHLNATTDLFMHQIDLRYTLLRYIIWVIPSLGFIGTVVGIALALNLAGQPGKFEDPNLLTEITQALAVAFNTTLLALLQAAIVLFLQSITQAREERALNRSAQYCLDNLVNRLYVE